MVDERLPGGNAGGATRVGDTVRRDTGPWTPAVHSLLRHLHAMGFDGAPLPLGIDDQGREILTFLEGATVGDAKPWPRWTRADASLDDVADWLRAFHDAVADFVPPRDAVWRFGETWSPGLIVGHNDAAPYNAVWRDGTLAGFIDWDFAAPVTREWDFAFVAFSWVPLHARAVVTAEGFSDYPSRPARLRRLLHRYGWEGDSREFIGVVQNRARASADGIRRLARDGDPLFGRLFAQGVATDLDTAATELTDLDF
jgi:hypothetical protein